MTGTPAVSVIVTEFNGGEFLGIALDSVLNQTFSDFELIVVDDASTDDAAAHLKQIHDTRLRVIRNSQNLGPAGARNVGIDAARGAYCAFLDHDDVALPFRLQRQMEFLQSNSAVGLLGSAVEFIDSAGKRPTTIVSMPQAHLEIRWRGLLETPMLQSTMMGRSEVVKRHRSDPKFRVNDDWDFAMRVARDTETRNLPEVLVRCHRHGTNLTTVYRARVNETAIEIALREIGIELPGFSISPSEVAELRRVVFDIRDGAQKRTLDTTRQALDRFIRLRDAFWQKHSTSG